MINRDVRYDRGRLLGLVHPADLLVLALCISLVGIPVVIISRILARIHHPELYVDSLPTVSKVAAYAPSDFFFEPGMTLVAICAFICWPMALILNNHRIRAYSTRRFERVMLYTGVFFSVLLGMIASISLAGLAIYSLEDSDSWHMNFSILFFSCQVFAFLLDISATMRLRYLSSRVADDGPKFSLNGKPWVTLVMFVGGVVFLYMFLKKDNNPLESELMTRWLYVGSEQLLIILFLLYPSLYYPEGRHYYGPDFSKRVTSKSP